MLEKRENSADLQAANWVFPNWNRKAFVPNITNKSQQDKKEEWNAEIFTVGLINSPLEVKLFRRCQRYATNTIYGICTYKAF